MFFYLVLQNSFLNKSLVKIKKIDFREWGKRPTFCITNIDKHKMYNNTVSDIQEIIIRYLDGTATLEEKNVLLQWLKSSDKNRIDFIEIRDLWLSCDAILGNGIEVDVAFERLRSRIHQSLNPKPTHKTIAVKWRQIAAVFIVLLSIGYSMYTRQTASQEVLIRNQLITAVGSKGQFILPDSSVVWLNSGSKLTYPERFEKNNRTVTLEGEAYFQVTENKKSPFVVKTEQVDIEVLGTSFNISNYATLPTVETVLLSGSIKVKMNTSGEEKLLNPDQLLTYQKETGETEIGITSSKYHIDWIKDRLVFDNDRLSDIIISLEGLYSVHIDCPKALSEQHRLSFTVRGEDIHEVLEAMSLIIPIKYKIDGNQVKITHQKTQ